MSARALGALVLGLAAVLLVCTPTAAWAATASSGMIGAETIVIVPTGHFVNALVDITWARRPPGRREFVALPRGFVVAQALHPRMAVRRAEDGVWLAGRPASVSLNVVFPATTPYLLEETTAAPIQAATLLVAVGAYPSGNALGPFAYRGQVRLGGRRLLAFAAENVAHGTQLFIPITLSDPVPTDRAVVAGALAILAAASVAGAAFWTLGRFGGRRGRNTA